MDREHAVEYCNICLYNRVSYEAVIASRTP